MQANIETYHLEIRWEGVDGADVAQDRNKRRALVNAVMNIRVC
jgi:limonene-1,2-epoxide hydrolase